MGEHRDIPVFSEHHTPTGMQPPPAQRSCCHYTHPCQSPCSTSLTCHLSCETASCTVQLKDPGVLSPEVNVVMHAEQPPDKLRASSSSRRRLCVGVGSARALRASLAHIISIRRQRISKRGALAHKYHAHAPHVKRCADSGRRSCVLTRYPMHEDFPHQHIDAACELLLALNLPGGCCA